MSLIHAPPARKSFDRATLRLRHRLFSGGTSDDAAQLRGWNHWMRWRQLPSPRARVRRAVSLALAPATAVRHAYAAVRQHGAAVAQAGGGSPLRQFAQLWALRVRHGIDTDAYLTFQLYRPERRRRAAGYIQVRELSAMTRLVNRHHGVLPEALMLGNKRRFEAWCREHGFRSVPTLLEIDGGRVVGGTVTPDALPAADLFSKPERSKSGLGARRWRYDGAGRYAGRDGVARTRDELVAHLAESSVRLGKPILVQACLRNHRDLLPLTPGGLCTRRFVTYRAPEGGIELLLGAYKMPVGDTVADNMAQGAVIARIDPETGRLGPVVQRWGSLFVDAERHPTTGARIVGVVLPYWAEAVALVRRAHAATERLLLVGWDVAIVDDGPVLVEGNTRPGSDIMQVASDVPLADTPLVGVLNRYARESFAI